MFEMIRSWYQRSFTNPQVVILGMALLGALLLIMLLGQPLAPVFAAIIIAYLLEGPVSRLQQFRVPRLVAVICVFVLFLTVLVMLLLLLAPLLSSQIAQFLQQIPHYVKQGQELLQRLPELYPQFISTAQIDEVIARMNSTDITSYGNRVLAWFWSSVLGLISLVVFLVLVPMMVFFLLKDKSVLLTWFTRYLPKNRELVGSVWAEVDRQIGNYVRGKVLEILIVGAVSWAVFGALGLQYSALLATITGFSVLIPFIGAAVVTLPVALVGFFQFGWGPEFFWVLAAYGVIQAIDGNVLVPVLFSEVNDLHPVAIIVAVLFFGSLWGFWGIFFAIPLATVVNAVLRAWPGHDSDNAEPQQQ